MKKVVKITFAILGILISILILDTLQAKIFNNSPILKVREYQGDNLVDKGLFVNHFKCNNLEEKTTWKITKYVCPVSEITLEDINDKIINFISKEENYINYAFNYIDLEKKVIVVGLVDNNKNNQEEFITKVFSSCRGSNYIDYLNNNSLIEFQETKDVFEAQIIVAEKDYIIVEVLKDSNTFKKGNKVAVKITRPTNGINDFYVVGNKVQITFNGNIEESNPAQIGAIKIELI